MLETKDAMELLRDIYSKQVTQETTLNALKQDLEKLNIQGIKDDVLEMNNDLYGGKSQSGLMLRIKQLENKVDTFVAQRNQIIGAAAAINVIVLIVSFLWNIYKEMPKQEPTYEKHKLENRTEKNQGFNSFGQKSVWEDYI